MSASKSQGSKSRIEIKQWNCEWLWLHVRNSSDLLRAKTWPPKGKSNTGKPTTKDIKSVQRLLGFTNSDWIFFLIGLRCVWIPAATARQRCMLEASPFIRHAVPHMLMADDHIRQSLWCFYEMKEGGFWMICQLLSVLFSLASGPAFFPPASHRSVVIASLSWCVSRWWLHKFKLAGFVHKGVKLEDQENQLCSCIFHVLSGGWYKQNAFLSGFWQLLPNLLEKWLWLFLCSQMRLLKTYSLSGNFGFFPQTSNKIWFYVMFNCRQFQVLRSLSWQM